VFLFFLKEEDIMKFRRVLGVTMIGGALLLNGNHVQAETLQEAVGAILKTNPDVRSIAHNRLGRDEEVRQARSGYLPQVDFIAGYGIQEIQEPVSDSLNPQQFTLSLRQNVFRGFATQNEIERQQARVRSEAYGLQGASENTALRTAEVYLNVLRQQELLRLAEENLNSHLRVGDQIKLRSDSGVASKSDSDQVTGRVSLAHSNVVVAKINLQDAQSNYLAVVGHLPADLQQPAPPPDSLMPATLEEAEDLAVKQHPTLKSAGADLDARQKQHEVAKAPYLPVIDLELDQNWEKDFDTSGSNDSLVAMIKLRYNLFRGFYDQARRAETIELVSEAREIKNGTHRQVIEAMRLSWMAHQAVKDRIKYLEQRVASTVETADSYTQQFNISKRTLLDVLDTEAEVIDAKRALVEARTDGLFAQYRILNGLGQLVKSFELEWPKESQVDGDDEGKTKRKENNS
jgi:adhesin transport system outer membrane protein